MSKKNLSENAMTADKIHAGMQKMFLAVVAFIGTLIIGNLLAPVTTGCEGAYMARELNTLIIPLLKPLLYIAVYLYAFDLLAMFFRVMWEGFAHVTAFFSLYISRYDWKHRGKILDDPEYKEKVEKLSEGKDIAGTRFFVFIKTAVPLAVIMTSIIYILPAGVSLLKSDFQILIYQEAVQECNFLRVTKHLRNEKLNNQTMTEFDPRLLLQPIQ